MKINIIAVGKLKEKYLTDAIKEYTKRISRFAKIEIIELNEEKTLEIEGDNILNKAKGCLIVFDLKGKLVTSLEYADIFESRMVQGQSEFSLVIGSSEGLAKKVVDKADIALCFGLVTYPHQLMRVIVAEQTYRAMTINNHITYHK
ncbi:MAG: 23S rRNA (pseudouridine(1915)-N(3))-methyltransferase RlmH [Clostridia bacterium]